MASLTEGSCVDALKALRERNDALAAKVEADDSRIDQLEMEIDEGVIAYMATRGPVATDCRFALAASKISSNLERIGDETTTIVRRARLLNQEPPMEPLDGFSQMGEMALEMLRDSMTVFIENKPALALEIIARDSAVDELDRRLTQELTELMKQSETHISRCLHLIRVVKCLERIADHASNIAEDVYYLYLGRDIRHGQEPLQSPQE